MAVDPSQMARIRRLRSILGDSSIAYLLYGPRPEFLDDLTAKQLLHLRRQHTLRKIFDYTAGLELYAEVSKPGSSLDAGLFVAHDLDGVHTLGHIHERAFEGTVPFSWFIVQHLLESGGYGRRPPESDALRRHPNPPRRPQSRSQSPQPPDIIDIVRGDEDAITRLLEITGEEVEGEWPFLPQHTLTITVRVGGTLRHDDVRIRQD